MPSIAKGMGAASPLSVRSVIVSVLVGILVICLFFINEIVEHFFGSEGHKKKSVVQYENQLSTAGSLDRVLEGDSKASSGSAFDGIFNLLNGSSSRSKKLDNTKLHTTNQLKGAREKLALKSEDKGLTWQLIREPDSMIALRSAVTGASKLVKNTPLTREKTRVALFNYIAGVRLVISGGERTMTAAEAIANVSDLDRKVVDSMRLENAPNGDINAWSQITLGPAFEKAGQLSMKSAQQVAFSPQFRILGVNVRQPPNQQKKWIEGGRAYLTLVAAVRGADVSKVLIFRDGVYYAERVPVRPNRKGDRLLNLRSINARGNYTFVVLGSANQKYEKSYTFYDRARKFPWRRTIIGNFVLPFYMQDPRIDRYFMTKEGSVTREANIDNIISTTSSELASF